MDALKVHFSVFFFQCFLVCLLMQLLTEVNVFVELLWPLSFVYDY